MTEAREKPTAVMSVLVPGTLMIAVTFGLARYGYGLLLPDMRAEIGMSASAAGLISSAAYVSYLVANIGVVVVTTRWGPRVAVGGAAAFAALGMAVIATADGVTALASGVLLAGAAAGMAFPPYADIVDRDVPEQRRDVVWSTISSGTGWGVALAGPVAIVAGDQWRAAWVVFVVIAVAVGALSVLLAPARTSDEQLRRPQLSTSWFFCPRSRPLLVSAVLVGAGSSVWWAFSVDAMRSSGLDATSSRVVYAVCGAAMLLASFSGIVFARQGLRLSYLGSTALLAASLGLLALATANLAAVLVAADPVRCLLCHGHRRPRHLERPGVRRPSGSRSRGRQHRAHHRHPRRARAGRHRDPVRRLRAHAGRGRSRISCRDPVLPAIRRAARDPR